ncbi:MAG: murein biosynthesis integral membrane protein MurJ, partial [Gammaproteobacteria bacterium]|nr:murein biosynthesis integral membrane protein MurJ [Gammaproteobacteria bacterium]
SFVPVISEYKQRRGEAEVRELVSGAAGTLGLALFALSILAMIAAPAIVWAFAPGFAPGGDRYAITVEMLRITFPYILFVSMTALASGVLNSYGRFGPPAFTQVLSNLAMIVAAVWVAPHFREPGLVLAGAVFVGGVLQVLYQIPFVSRLRLLGWPRWRWDHEGVRRVARLMGPGILGSSVAQVSLLLDTQIASFLATGSVSWIYFASRLMEFPQGVFSVALGTVILPSLSAHHAAAAPERVSATLDWALRLVLVIVTPAAVALLVLAGPLIATIFGHGRFHAIDVRMSAYALRAFSIGLLGFSFVKVLAPGYFARQDTRTPVRISLISLGVNIGVNLCVIAPLVYLKVLPVPHAFLAVSTSLAGCTNALLLYRGLRRGGVLRPTPGWPALLGRTIAASAAMALVLAWLAGPTGTWIAMSSWRRVGHLGICVLAGAAVYFAALAALGARPRHLQAAIGAESGTESPV